MCVFLVAENVSKRVSQNWLPRRLESEVRPVWQSNCKA